MAADGVQHASGLVLLPAPSLPIEPAVPVVIVANAILILRDKGLGDCVLRQFLGVDLIKVARLCVDYPVQSLILVEGLPIH